MQENVTDEIQDEHNNVPLIKTRQCQKKARRCRRTLPKFGTPERLELLREDAKRRMREAASRHTCPFCSYCAPFPSKVKRHIVNRHSKAHSCSKCDRHFDNFSELRVHVSVEHPKIHHCQFCSFSHKVRAEVRKHTIINHGNGVTCTVTGCNLRIARWRLKNHLKTAHPDSLESVPLRSERLRLPSVAEDSIYNCSRCEFVTNVLQDFNSHVMNAHETGIQCLFVDCSERILLHDFDRHLLSVHERSNSDREINGKETCLSNQLSSSSCDTGRATSSMSESISALDHSVEFPSDPEDSSSAPKSHCKLLGNSIGMQCALCGRDYRTSYLLKKHIKTVHEKAYAHYRRARKYVCDWEGCEKTFTTSGLLEDHLNSHRGVKPYSCRSCGISFSARSRFAVHLSKYHRMSIRDHRSISEFLEPSARNNSQS